jgi:hypothetical protein
VFTPRIIAMLLVMLTVSCGGKGLDSTDDSVIFGEGVRPPAIPNDFPIPPEAVIGSTLIDRTNHRTEMALQVGSDMESVVRYFNIGLVNEGFVVGSSSGSEAAWKIDFSRDELIGEISFTAQGDITRVLVAVNDV